MDNFNVNITIKDICCNNCCRSINERTLQLTNSSDVVSLQDNFSFRIISTANGRAVMEIRKSFLRFIRFGYVNIPTNICLPCGNCCAEHRLVITINSIVTN